MKLQAIDRELNDRLEALAVEQIEDKKALGEMHTRAPFLGYKESAMALNAKIKERGKLICWLTELQERRGEDGWISVKDKLPEDDGNYLGNYLVFTSEGDIDIGTYHPRYIVPQWSMCDADGFYWAEDKDIKILAWKPLPNKPDGSEG